MKSIIILLAALFCFSCTRTSDNKPDVLEGVYIDANNATCLIINEYEPGKLGYYVFDHRKGFENYAKQFVLGTITIKVQNKDSIADFKVLKKTVKSSSLPYSINVTHKIEEVTKDMICFSFGISKTVDKRSVTCWGKMKESPRIKKIKDGLKDYMKENFQD